MDICQAVYCVAEPHLFTGSVGGPLLAITLLAASIGARPKRSYPRLKKISTVAASACLVACLYLLLRGPEGLLPAASGAGCLLFSLAIWLYRADPWGGEPGEGGEEEPEKPDPGPGSGADWDRAKEKLLREERRRQPVG